MGVIGDRISTGGRITQVSQSIGYILVAVLFSGFGQIMLKHGMNNIGALTINLNSILDVLWRIGTNPWVMIGLFIYAASTVFWLTALSRVELSYAYPFASLSYAIMLVAAWQLFNESISPLRLVGTLVVCIGVLLISRS